MIVNILRNRYINCSQYDNLLLRSQINSLNDKLQAQKHNLLTDETKQKILAIVSGLKTLNENNNFNHHIKTQLYYLNNYLKWLDSYQILQDQITQLHNQLNDLTNQQRQIIQQKLQYANYINKPDIKISDFNIQGRIFKIVDDIPNYEKLIEIICTIIKDIKQTKQQIELQKQLDELIIKIVIAYNNYKKTTNALYLLLLKKNNNVNHNFDAEEQENKDEQEQLIVELCEQYKINNNPLDDQTKRKFILCILEQYKNKTPKKMFLLNRCIDIYNRNNNLLNNGDTTQEIQHSIDDCNQQLQALQYSSSVCSLQIEQLQLESQEGGEYILDHSMTKLLQNARRLINELSTTTLDEYPKKIQIIEQKIQHATEYLSLIKAKSPKAIDFFKNINEIEKNQQPLIQNREIDDLQTNETPIIQKILRILSFGLILFLIIYVCFVR